MKKTVLAAASILCGAILLGGCQSSADLSAAQQPSVTTITPAKVRSDFIKGVDLSMVPQIEALGGKYYQDHKAMDPVEIMHEHGVNYVRMRIWVDPQDLKGAPYGGGNSTLAKAIEMGKRAHAHGMKYLLDIHYSDFWTDPGKQMKPKAWEKLNFEQLVDQVADYTKQVMQAHRAAGVMPDMVQVGNELNSGMLWPDGKSWGGDGHEFDRLAKLLKAGIHEVRQAYKPNEHVQIMLHLAKAGDNGAFRWWFDEITKRHVDFDIIGMSYYPYWHGPMDAVQKNIKDMVSRYNKPVIIVETAYAYTTANGDALGNNFAGDKPVAGYPVSVAGQAKFVKDLMEMVNNIPDNKGLGIFYWEPAWIPVKGATWATKPGMQYIKDVWQEGNAWDNQAMFDFKGNVLPSMQVFNAQ